MAITKGKRYDLTENQIRYAMSNTWNCREAANWLNVSQEVFRRCATQYYDSETGLNLYELHKKKAHKNKLVIPIKDRVRARLSPKIRRQGKIFTIAKLEDIFNGHHPNYKHEKFQERVFIEGYKKEQCERCGFDQRRAIDYSMPIKLTYIDENSRNKSLENLRVLCFNCIYITTGTEAKFHYAPKQFVLDPVTGEAVTRDRVKLNKSYERANKVYDAFGEQVPSDKLLRPTNLNVQEVYESSKAESLEDFSFLTED